MANDKSFKIKNGILAQRYLQTSGTETAGSEGYNLAGAAYDSKSFSVATQETAPRSVNFKSDGTKMYVIGTGSDTVYQYTLSTTWDVSTASYDSVGFSVATQDGAPFDIAFKPDGTKFYIAGNNSSAVYQYSLSTAWDMSTASYDSVSFSVSTQGPNPHAVLFKDDGTAMYALSSNNETIFQYTLGTAWDVSTASYASKSYAFANTPDAGPENVAFNDTGTKFYMVGTSGDAVYQYSVSTAWDISTVSYDSISFSVAGQDTTPHDVFFGNSGTKMYIVGNLTDTIYQYSTVALTQTLDLSTGTYFSLTPSGATTVLFTNPPASGLAIGFSVEIIGDGSAITWPASVKWHEATAPTATATKEIYVFITTDGGTTYYGKKAAEGVA